MTPRPTAFREALASMNEALDRADRDRLAARARAEAAATATERYPRRLRALRTETAAATVLLLVAFLLVALA